jgi:hypothetical protein
MPSATGAYLLGYLPAVATTAPAREAHAALARLAALAPAAGGPLGDPAAWAHMVRRAARATVTAGSLEARALAAGVAAGELMAALHRGGDLAAAEQALAAALADPELPRWVGVVRRKLFAALRQPARADFRPQISALLEELGRAFGS